MNLTHNRILEFLKQEFDPECSFHFLAVAAVEQQHYNPCPEITFKIRLAMTLQDENEVNPYFEGTDLFVVITPSEIRFTQEEDWADGPPIREGSPLELALGWVSELAAPFFVSSHARDVARTLEEWAAPNDHGEDYSPQLEGKEFKAPKTLTDDEFYK